MNKPILDVFESGAELAATAAHEVATALRIAIAEHGRASLVATGGRSPGAVYDALSGTGLDWSKVMVSLSDERWVEPSSSDSNEKLVRERLLVGKAASAQFVPLKHPVRDAAASAAQAAAGLAPLVPIDVLLLGMGDDGHIASLFPGNPALAAGLKADGEALAIGVPAGDPAPNIDRISLTLAALKTAGLTLILISGEAKRQVVTGPHDKPAHALIEAAQGKVRILWTP